MIKKIFNQRCKKVLSFLLVGSIFFSTISNVYAKTLTINEVANGFKNSTIIDGLNQLGGNITSSVDTTNKTLDVYSESEKVFSFKYTDDYIEYDNRSAIVSKETAEKDVLTMFMLYGVFDSIFKLSGYEDKTLSEDGIYTDTYDTYGIQLITESYSYSGTDDDGGTWSMSGEFIKYFKMSFDTDKIDALMTKYGVDASTQDPNKEIILGLTPTLEAKEITENSITLYPHIAYTNTDPDYKVFCYVYRSTSENGTYEKISDMAVNCLDEVGVVDEKLSSNTTYYYKAVVMDGTKYSEPLKVTTKEATIPAPTNTNNTNKDDVVENPKTGVTLPVATLGIMMIGSIIALIVARKKSVFKQI